MSKIKKYPLEIENVGWDLMSKSHHDPSEFMLAVRKYYNWSLGEPEHVWIKTTPDNKNGGSLFNIVNKGTRGSFPATYCWEK